MAQEVRSAGWSITLDTDDIGRLLGFSSSDSISEEEVAGLSDTVGDPPIIKEQYNATSIGSTASFNGILIKTDAGQTAVETAKDTGSEITLDFTDPAGDGYSFTGFITGYEKTAEKPDSQKFSADMRVNDKADITGGI